MLSLSCVISVKSFKQRNYLKHYKWFEYAGLKAQESNMLFRLGTVATYGGKYYGRM